MYVCNYMYIIFIRNIWHFLLLPVMRIVTTIYDSFFCFFSCYISKVRYESSCKIRVEIFKIQKRKTDLI